MEKVTNVKAMKWRSAKITGCLTMFLPLFAIFLISYILSSWNRHLIARDYYRSIKKKEENNSECNLFTGKWIPSSHGTYYTNESNCIIDDRQDCMTFGRPDTEFMKWRWKPDECELPRFNANLFLELMRGKTMALIGDSLARNQMQSLTCMLSSVDDPVDTLENKPGREWGFKQFRFGKYNFTVDNFWSHYLVKSEDADTSIYAPNTENLYLDIADKIWTSHIHTFDYVIISAGQWFFRPVVYYQNGNRVGCHACNNNATAPMGAYYGYSNAFRTAFRALLDSDKFNGTVFLRTYSPRHFENGDWDSGGSCPRTIPTRRPEIGLGDFAMTLYRTAIDELRAAEKIGKKKGLKFGILDITRMMAMRTDAHPNRHGPGFGDNATAADCVHWCLPGAIDTWNEILLQLILR